MQTLIHRRQKHKDHVENNAGDERDATDAAGGRERAAAWVGRSAEGPGAAHAVFGEMVGGDRALARKQARGPQTSFSQACYLSTSAFALRGAQRAPRKHTQVRAHFTLVSRGFCPNASHTSPLSLPKSHHRRFGGGKPSSCHLKMPFLLFSLHVALLGM